ncbi:MAG: response regulator [Acidobacteria bacterium]|nr:response regulator [Acidobacteriota bacterium]
MRKKILIAVNDMFFAARIRAVAEQLGVELKLAKQAEQVLELSRSEKPDLVIFDLNDIRYQPLDTIRRMKADPELAEIKIIGYLSHVQVELHRQATQAGCDQVLAKSAFTGLLPELLSE